MSASADDLIDVFFALEVEAHVAHFRFKFRQEVHFVRGDHVDFGVELAQRVAEAVHGAHAHIADHDPGQAVERAALTPDGEGVGQDLGGMLAPAVAAVDHRHAGMERGFGGRALLEVAHGDHVAVIFQHLDGVLNAFLVEVTGARHLGIGEAGHMPAQAVHRGFRRQTGAGARLVERRDKRLFFQQIPIAAVARIGLEPFGDFKYAEILVTIKVL